MQYIVLYIRANLSVLLPLDDLGNELNSGFITCVINTAAVQFLKQAISEAVCSARLPTCCRMGLTAMLMH